jgi:hypothetical protein
MGSEAQRAMCIKLKEEENVYNRNYRYVHSDCASEKLFQETLPLNSTSHSSRDKRKLEIFLKCGICYLPSSSQVLCTR